MISLPNGQTPTDLMLTPNWPDQNAGNGRCGRRSGSRLTMLCAATSAPRTALSQCSSTRNWYSYSTWGKRAMSPTTKMDSVTTPLISKARKPASQPTPQKPAARPDPSSHSVLRIEPSDASTTSHCTTLSSESRARRTWPLPSPSSDFTPIPVRRSTPWSRCISAAIAPITPPSELTSGAEPLSTTVTGRPNSRQTEATSDPIKPAPMTRTRPGLAASAFCKPAASALVRIVYTPSRAASLALGHSRARVPVAISRRSYGTCSPLAKRTCLVTRSKPVAAIPSRHSASTCRTRGSLVWSAGTQPFSTCFERGGRSYGSSGSSPMMVRCPVKPSLRNASAARSPAREAPTMTMRPVLLNAATKSATISFVEAFTTLHPLFCRLDVRPRWLAPGRLQRRAGPSSVWHRRGWGRTSALPHRAVRRRWERERRIARIPGTYSDQRQFACEYSSCCCPVPLKKPGDLSRQREIKLADASAQLVSSPREAAVIICLGSFIMLVSAETPPRGCSARVANGHRRAAKQRDDHSNLV